MLFGCRSGKISEPSQCCNTETVLTNADTFLGDVHMAEPTLFDAIPAVKTKTCKHCGVSKPISEFHRNRTLPDGHYNTCKPCTNQRAVEWKRAHPELVTAQRRRDRVRAKELGKIPSVVQWVKNNPERAAIARRSVSRTASMIRQGRLVRPDRCEKCGRVGKVHAAHHDYDKPLDVRWLCPVCHGKWDKAEPKTLAIVQHKGEK